MKIVVLLSSGEVDPWPGVAEAHIVDGFLHILLGIESDVIPETMKTFEVVSEIPRPALKPLVKTTTYQLLAIYAPAMWMRVTFAR